VRSDTGERWWLSILTRPLFFLVLSVSRSVDSFFEWEFESLSGNFRYHFLISSMILISLPLGPTLRTVTCVMKMFDFGPPQQHSMTFAVFKEGFIRQSKSSTFWRIRISSSVTDEDQMRVIVNGLRLLISQSKCCAGYLTAERNAMTM
jgi:hypothetical protein